MTCLGAWRTNDGDYFLGSVVLVQRPCGDDVDIIDGRQRMVCCASLLALLLTWRASFRAAGDLSKRWYPAESTFKGLDDAARSCANATAVLRHVHRRRPYRFST